MNAKVFAIMLFVGMAAGGAADQVSLYLDPETPEAGFGAQVPGAGNPVPVAEPVSLRSAVLDQPARR